MHPVALGLRAASLTGSITVAAMAGRLRAALPATANAGLWPEPPLSDALVEDLTIGQALQLDRLWRRLAERRSWAPLADAASLRRLLAQLGCHASAEDAMAAWLPYAGIPLAARAKP